MWDNSIEIRQFLSSIGYNLPGIKNGQCIDN